MKFKTGQPALLRFETAAMTDIVFLLLIFFLLSSSFIVQTGIKVDLPAATSPQPQDSARIVLSVTQDEVVFVNEKKVRWSEIQTELESLLEVSDDKLVVVRGDRQLSLGKTVEVMDIARRSGAVRLAIAADYVRAGTEPRS
jgi:biopolymer transport protein ExbD